MERVTKEIHLGFKSWAFVVALSLLLGSAIRVPADGTLPTLDYEVMRNITRQNQTRYSSTLLEQSDPNNSTAALARQLVKHGATRVAGVLAAWHVIGGSGAIAICWNPYRAFDFDGTLVPCVTSETEEVIAQNARSRAYAYAKAITGVWPICDPFNLPYATASGRNASSFAYARNSVNVRWDRAPVSGKRWNSTKNAVDTVFYYLVFEDFAMAATSSAASTAWTRTRISNLDSAEVHADIPAEAVDSFLQIGYTPTTADTVFYDLRVELISSDSLSVTTSSLHPVSYDLDTSDFYFDNDTLGYAGPDTIFVPIAIQNSAYSAGILADTVSQRIDVSTESFAEDASGSMPGDVCIYAIVITVPIDLPYSDLTQYTCGRGNDYDNTCLGDFDEGEDIIYELSVDSTVCVNIIVDPKGTPGTGIAIDDNCPPDATCIATATDTTGSTYLIQNLKLDPGTYTIMIDSRSGTPCIPDFDLYITKGQVIDACGPDFGLTFAWYQDGQIMEEVKWYYRYLPDGAESATVESHTGELDFRVKHPEHDGKRVHFYFFAPPGQNGWRQLILGLSSGGTSDVYTVGDFPGEWHIPDVAALLGSDCGDTIFTAVDLNLYGASNPDGFGEPGGTVGKNLSGLGVIIVDGQVEGLEGIYWASSEWTLDTTGRWIFKPIGGVGTLLNSADCPDDLVVVAEHVGGILEGGTTCCSGTRGNVDGDADERVNIGDLTFLVSYLFDGGSPPPCWEEADIDGNDSVNVADVTSLVDYLFSGGPAPLSCP